MCCFSAKTEVYGTSIFARFTRPATQVLAYQMRYKAERPTAMILPLPVSLPAKEDAVRWKSLKEYPTFFDDLGRGFPPKPSLSRSKSAPAAQSAAAPLAVHEVGDFIATFVPQMSDFGRVDPRFTIARDVWARIPAYADYGFAVFQLKELAGSPHPIAFEFETRTPGTLFFPTVHIHDGTVHPEEQFDHALYLQESTFDARVRSYDGPDAVDDRTGFVRSRDKLAAFADAARSQGVLDADLLLHKAEIRGRMPNRDTMFDLRAIATRSVAGCGRCDVATTGDRTVAGMPGAALAALAWIIRRRDARRGRYGR